MYQNIYYFHFKSFKKKYTKSKIKFIFLKIKKDLIISKYIIHILVESILLMVMEELFF